MIYFFNSKKCTAEGHRSLVEAYAGADLRERSYREWFQKLKNGEFALEDKERSGGPKDKELEALLEEHSCQIQEEHAPTYIRTHSTSNSPKSFVTENFSTSFQSRALQNNRFNNV